MPPEPTAFGSGIFFLPPPLACSPCWPGDGWGGPLDPGVWPCSPGASPLPFFCAPCWPFGSEAAPAPPFFLFQVGQWGSNGCGSCAADFSACLAAGSRWGRSFQPVLSFDASVFAEVPSFAASDWGEAPSLALAGSSLRLAGENGSSVPSWLAPFSSFALLPLVFWPSPPLAFSGDGSWASSSLVSSRLWRAAVKRLPASRLLAGLARQVRYCSAAWRSRSGA